MICPACGSENSDAGASCFTCGQNLLAPPALTKGSLVAGRYEILSPLGRGGMGMVYKAHDRVLEETVALKVLRPDVAQAPDMARRFRSEIKLARKVTHTNVCRIHDYGEDGAMGYIAMEYVAGMDLKQLRAKRGQLSTAEAYEAAIQMVEALQAIHDAGVVHRDLKTANVMLDANGRIRLMDFGIAKQMGATLGGTAMGQVIGTPEYMSPEQARGLKLDFRSDIYSMGIVIYEVFSGHVPFRGDTPIATIYLNLEQPPVLDGPAAAGIPVALVPVLAKALAKNPDDRFASARELSEQLKAARHASFPEAAPAPVSLPAPPTTAFIEGVTTTLARAGPTPGATPAAAATLPQPARMTPPPSTPTPQPALPVTVMMPTPTAKWKAPAPAIHARPPVSRPPERAAVQRTAQAAPSRVGLWLTLGSVLLIAALGSLGLLVKELIGARTSRATARTEASPGALDVAPPPPREVGTPTDSRAAALPEIRTPEPPRQRPIRPGPDTGTPRIALSPVSGASSPTSAPERRADVRASASDAPPKTPESPASEATGVLQFVVKPWAEVTVDGNPLGTTPLQPISLSVGSHTVRLSHPDYRPLQRKVDIEAGSTTRLEIDLKWEAVRKPSPNSQ